LLSRPSATTLTRSTSFPPIGLVRGSFEVPSCRPDHELKARLRRALSATSWCAGANTCGHAFLRAMRHRRGWIYRRKDRLHPRSRHFRRHGYQNILLIRTSRSRTLHLSKPASLICITGLMQFLRVLEFFGAAPCATHQAAAFLVAISRWCMP
jgi:hypothetical protein